MAPDQKRECPSPVLRSFSVHYSVLACTVEALALRKTFPRRRMTVSEGDENRAARRAKLGAYGRADSLEAPF